MMAVQPTKTSASCARSFCISILCGLFILHTSCEPARRPVPNTTLAQLPTETKAAYRTLLGMLDAAGRDKLDQSTSQIRDPLTLRRCIETNLRLQQTYQILRAVLPKEEGRTLEEAVQKTYPLEMANGLIQQSAAYLRFFLACSGPLQQNCMDLLQILPDKQAEALKGAIAESSSRQEVENHIVAHLPQKLQTLDAASNEALTRLPQKERIEILLKLVREEGLPIQPELEASGVSSHYQGDTTLGKAKNVSKTTDAMAPRPDVEHREANGDGRLPAHAATQEAVAAGTPTSATPLEPSGLDLSQLVGQTTTKVASKRTKDVTFQDDWGRKLPLQGAARERFLDRILQFSHADQTTLKALFDAAVPANIQNFLSVYETGFQEEQERIALLGTLIYLYQGWPELTLKLCNNPSALTTRDKVTVFRKADSKQLKLLNKLDQLLSNA